MFIIKWILIVSSLFIVIKLLKNANFTFHKVTIFFLRFFSGFSIFIFIYTKDIILAFKCWGLFISEALFVNFISIYIINISKKINKQIGADLHYLIFFYSASPIAIVSMYYNYFPNELIISNCFISCTALVLILKYSVSIVMSNEIKKISLFDQLFLLLILMTGSIFSFANFNYSINIYLNNNSSNIKIEDYIFLYSSIFTLNYDSLVLQIAIDKLLASFSMIYSYFFISIVVATIIKRLNKNI